MRIEDQRGGNGSVPGTRRKAVPIAMATGPAEYTAGQQELPVRLTSLAGKSYSAVVITLFFPHRK